MRSVLLLSALITAVAVNLIAQAAAPQPSRPKQELCAVAGRVVTAAEGTPLRSAHVLLIAERPGREPRTYAAISDGNGAFALTRVLPGRYMFFAQHTGYVSQQYRSQSAESGAVLALQPGQQVSDILFRLILAVVVTGRVSDEDEEPMAGIQVMALRRPSEDEVEDEGLTAARKQDQLLPANSALTDDRGQYRIFGLAPGDYYLKATESLQPPMYSGGGEEYFALQSLGAEYAPIYYPGVLQRSQAEAVSLRPGDEAQVDFSMRHIRTVEISGRVLAPDGKPASALVELQEKDDYTDNRNTNTDSDGKFRIKGVPPGSYVLAAYQQSSDNRYRPAAKQELQVGDQNIDSLNLVLTRGTEFDGRLIVEGPIGPLTAHVYISLFSTDGEMGDYGAQAKPDGSFEITGVHQGNYAIQVFGGGESNWYLKSARLGSDDVLEHGLQVEKGTAGTLEIIIAPASAQLAGSVAQDDKPVAGARVRIVPDPETVYNRMRRRDTTTDQDGQFLFLGVAPGRYRVTARSPAVPGGEGAAAEPQAVTLSERDHKAVQLKLVPARNQ